MIIYRNIFALLTCKGNFRFVRLTSIHYRNLLLQVNIFLRLYYVQKKGEPGQDLALLDFRNSLFTLGVCPVEVVIEPVRSICCLVSRDRVACPRTLDVNRLDIR